MNNLHRAITAFNQEKVIAYPTEAVFGLGCNPKSEKAVRALLALKKREEKKGLILIAPTIKLLLPYLDETKLSDIEWQRFSTIGTQAITWIMPAKPNLPRFLTGQFNSIAMRLCQTPAVEALCLETQSAITSTSANLSGREPCRSSQQVYKQFGTDFPVLEGETEQRKNPSEIRDIFTQQVLRAG